MQSSERNRSRYQLKKQAVFDALYKCCEINKEDQVSLSSVLQYISKEIDSNFNNSEYILKELKQMLIDKNKEGWLSFTEVCEILGNWMDIVSCTSTSITHKNNLDVFEYASSKLTCHKPYPTSPHARKNILNGIVNNIESEKLFSKCEKCGREENYCCEWRKNETNREEKITRCYEQRITELQNLLRQSEDCNSLLQLEYDSLRQDNILLKNKEVRWSAKEEELTEREQQISSTNLLLKEQTFNAEREIQNLKQQLCHVKSEHDKLVSENHILEERSADIPRLEKLVDEARQHQFDMQRELQAKNAIVIGLESKLEESQERNEILEAQIAELKSSKSSVSSMEWIRKQSLGEELTIADISIVSTCESNELVSFDIPAENSLKAELDACGQWPLVFEHIAIQATPSVCTTATQTNGDLSLYIKSHSEEINCSELKSVYFSPNISCDEKKLVSLKEDDNVFSAPSVFTSGTQTDDDLYFEGCKLLKSKSINKLSLEDILSYFNEMNEDKKLFLPEHMEMVSANHNNLSVDSDEDCVAFDVDMPKKSISDHRQQNTRFHSSSQHEDREFLLSKHFDKFLVSSGTEGQIPNETSKQHLDVCMQLEIAEQTTAPSFSPSISENSSSLYVPNVEKQDTQSYHSTCKMELFLAIDASTQTKPVIEEQNNEVTDVSHFHEVSSEKQCSTMNSQTSVFLLNKFNPFLNITMFNKNGCGDSHQRSVKTESIISVMEVMRKENMRIHGKSLWTISRNLLLQHNLTINIPLNYILSVQLFCQRQFEACTSFAACIYCKTLEKIQRPVCWNGAVKSILQQTKKVCSLRFQSRLIQALIVIIAWYLFDSWMQLQDGMWQNLPPFWSELHRVLAPKLELRWPNGPPPQ